jgi:DNA-directed RNA polymerase specialized sigma24 family protein
VSVRRAACPSLATPPDEIHFMKRVARREKEALRELAEWMEANSSRTIGYLAYRYGLSPGDLYQDVWVLVRADARKFVRQRRRPSSLSLHSWIRRLADSTAKNALRSETRRRVREHEFSKQTDVVHDDGHEINLVDLTDVLERQLPNEKAVNRALSVADPEHHDKIERREKHKIVKLLREQQIGGMADVGYPMPSDATDEGPMISFEGLEAQSHNVVSLSIDLGVLYLLRTCLVVYPETRSKHRPPMGWGGGPRCAKPDAGMVEHE